MLTEQEQMDRWLAYRSAHNRFGQMLGIEIVEYAKGYAKAVMQVRPEFMNPLGTVHGGCLYALADTVGGSASATYGFITPTVSGDLHFLNPAKDMDRIYGTARAVKHGRTLAVYEVTLLGPDEKSVLAVGTFTYFNKGMPLESAEGGDAQVR